MSRVRLLAVCASFFSLSQNITIGQLLPQTASTASMPPSVASTPTAIATPLNGDVVPAIHLRDGKAFQVLVSLAGCKANDGKDYSKLNLSTLSGSGLTVQGGSTYANCGLTATLVADSSTPPGKLPLFIVDNGQTKGTVFLQIVDAVPGPIPPGISPQVDVLWNVLSPNITQDTFGGWVNKRYYAVEVVIGNNSGYELQIASVGFNLRDFAGHTHPLPLPTDDDMLDQWRHVPTNDYHVVRASPEKEQLFGRRTTVVNIAEAAALLATGVTPFFRVARHQATYSTAVNLLSNPFSKGLSLVWPDLTVPELNRLDNLALHDNAILPNNSQTRTIVFVDRHLLTNYFARNQTDHSKMGFTNSTKITTPSNVPEINTIGPCDGAVKPKRNVIQKVAQIDLKNTRLLCNGNEPQDVKYWLGDLILVGDQIEFHQRIYLGSNQAKPAATATQKITIAPATAVDTVLANLGRTVTLTDPGGDLSSLPSDPTSIPVNPQLKLVLAAPGSDKTVRTGTLTAVPAGTLLDKGPYALSIPYKPQGEVVSQDEVINITVTAQKLTFAEKSVKRTDFAAPNGATITITSDGDLSKFDPGTDIPGVTATSSPTGDGKTALTNIKLVMKGTVPPSVTSLTVTDKQSGKAIGPAIPIN